MTLETLPVKVILENQNPAQIFQFPAPTIGTGIPHICAYMIVSNVPHPPFLIYLKSDEAYSPYWMAESDIQHSAVHR